MVRIGEEVTRKVDYTPGTLEVIETVRPKYARPEAEQTDDKPAIVIADLPDQVLPKSIAGAGLRTEIVVAKYIDHLPFYRQIGMFKRDHGWAIHKSTMNDWFAATCTLLEPLYAVLMANVLNTDYLQGDESRLIVLEYSKEQAKNKRHRHPPKLRRKSHLGYMWVFRNPVTGGVFFAYRPGRGANVLNETLGEFKGKLQRDGYSAYTAYLKKHTGVELVSCLAHIRRKFFYAQSSHRELAELALQAIKY
jgi:transposase